MSKKMSLTETYLKTIVDPKASVITEEATSRLTLKFHMDYHEIEDTKTKKAKELNLEKYGWYYDGVKGGLMYPGLYWPKGEKAPTATEIRAFLKTKSKVLKNQGYVRKEDLSESNNYDDSDDNVTEQILTEIKSAKDIIELIGNGSVKFRKFTQLDMMTFQGDSKNPELQLIDDDACGGKCTIIVDNNEVHIVSNELGDTDWISFEIKPMNM